MKTNRSLLILILLMCKNVWIVEAKVVKQPTARGLNVREGMHRHVVMIARKTPQRRRRQELNKNKEKKLQVDKGKLYEVIGSGSVLNTRWILTAFIALKEEKSADGLYIIPGYQNKVDQYKTTLQVEKIAKFIDSDVGAKFPKHKSLALLKTKEGMMFSYNLGDVFFSFEHGYRKYLHCEIVNYYFEHISKKFIKTQIPVQLHTKDCKHEDKTEICVKVTLVDRRLSFNPCFENKVNLGAPIMCDIDLEAVFYGCGFGQGCDSLSEGGLRAFVISEHEPTTTWIFNTLKKDTNDTEAVNDYYYDVENKSYDYREDFIYELITLHPDLNKRTTRKIVYPTRLPPTKKRKCSNGDRWDGHLLFTMLLLILCKCLY